MKDLKILDQEELATMYNAPVWVALLIAGADSHIDKKEIKEAISIANLKRNRARKDLVEYYHEVANNFENNLKGHLALLPKDTREQAEILIENLEKLNPILTKIDPTFSVQFYESLKDLASKVAHATGGVMGFLSVGYEESKLVGLKMIKDPSNK